MPESGAVGRREGSLEGRARVPAARALVRHRPDASLLKGVPGRSGRGPVSDGPAARIGSGQAAPFPDRTDFSCYSCYEIGRELSEGAGSLPALPSFWETGNNRDGNAAAATRAGGKFLTGENRVGPAGARNGCRQRAHPAPVHPVSPGPSRGLAPRGRPGLP